MDEIYYIQQFGAFKLEVYTRQTTKLEALKEAEKILKREILRHDPAYYHNLDNGR